MTKLYTTISLLIIRPIAYLVSVVFPYKMTCKVFYLRDILYSNWLCYSLRMSSTNFFGRKCLLHGNDCIRIGKNNKFGAGTMISAWKNPQHRPLIQIGDNCNLGRYNHITCCNRVTIGSGVLTGMFVLISDNAHGETHCRHVEALMTPPEMRKLISQGEVIIEDNVWVGDKVAILPGVKIGKGAIIGANAVVTKDVPAYAVAVGNPARVIRTMDLNSQ